jgi:hypothetical protein
MQMRLEDCLYAGTPLRRHFDVWAHVTSRVEGRRRVPRQDEIGVVPQPAVGEG